MLTYLIFAFIQSSARTFAEKLLSEWEAYDEVQ